MVGSYTDVFAHNYLISAKETFLTPWHAILYASLTLMAILFASQIFKNRERGYPWREILPSEYIASLWGIAVFFAAGICDLIWHILFGIETDIDSHLSPTHLFLVLGVILILTAHLRRGWQKKGAVVPVAFDAFAFLRIHDLFDDHPVLAAV